MFGPQYAAQSIQCVVHSVLLMCALCCVHCSVFPCWIGYWPAPWRYKSEERRTWQLQKLPLFPFSPYSCLPKTLIVSNGLFPKDRLHLGAAEFCTVLVQFSTGQNWWQLWQPACSKLVTNILNKSKLNVNFRSYAKPQRYKTVVLLQ